MAIVLKQKEVEATFFIPDQGQKVNLIYSRATTKEKQAYKSAVAQLMIKHQGTNNTQNYIDELTSLRTEWGYKKLSGVFDGDFYINENDEHPISSNPERTKDFVKKEISKWKKANPKKVVPENVQAVYYEGWKGVIREEYPEILTSICDVVFGEVNQLPNTEKKRVSYNS